MQLPATSILTRNRLWSRPLMAGFQRKLHASIAEAPRKGREMSKIYEALRQAELERAKSGATRSDSSAGESTASQALLEANRYPHRSTAPQRFQHLRQLPRQLAKEGLLQHWLTPNSAVHCDSRPAPTLPFPMLPSTSGRRLRQGYALHLEPSAAATSCTGRAGQFGGAVPQPALAHAGVSRPQHPQVNSCLERFASGGQELYRREPGHLPCPPQGRPGTADRWRHAPRNAPQAAGLFARAGAYRVSVGATPRSLKSCNAPIPTSQITAARRPCLADLYCGGP